VATWKVQNPDKVEQEKMEKAEHNGVLMPGPSPTLKPVSPVKMKREKVQKPKGAVAQGPRKARSTAGKDGFHPDLVLG
jgi:hypothetical protein